MSADPVTARSDGGIEWINADDECDHEPDFVDGVAVCRKCDAMSKGFNIEAPSEWEPDDRFSFPDPQVGTAPPAGSAEARRRRHRTL